MMTDEDIRISNMLGQMEDNAATMAKGSRKRAAWILDDIQDHGISEDIQDHEISENTLYRQGKIEGIASGYTAALRDLADTMADTFELTPEAQDRLQGCILTMERAWQDTCRNHADILTASRAGTDGE